MDLNNENITVVASKQHYICQKCDKFTSEDIEVIRQHLKYCDANRCMNRGCMFIGNTRELFDHRSICQYYMIYCISCCQMINSSDFVDHRGKCENEELVCEFCTCVMTRSIFRKHIVECYETVGVAYDKLIALFGTEVANKLSSLGQLGEKEAEYHVFNNGREDSIESIKDTLLMRKGLSHIIDVTKKIIENDKCENIIAMKKLNI